MLGNWTISRPIHLAAACLLLSAAGASAASQGEFDVTYTGGGFVNGEWLEIGPNLYQRMNLLELTTTGEGGFLGTTRATCHFTQEKNTTSGAFKNMGWCTWRDGAGNLLFEAWEASWADAAETGFGTGRLTGGTGKFAGITGVLSFSYDPSSESGRQRGFYNLPGE